MRPLRIIKSRALVFLPALALAVATIIGADTMTAPMAHAGPVYHAIDADKDPYNGIYLRNGTSMANVTRTAANYITYGTSIELLCGTNGEAVGPYRNVRWHYVRVVATGRNGWIADRYTDTPNRANQPTPGEPECGSTTTSSAFKESWVGSGVTGIYDAGYPVDGPATHHLLSNTTEHEFAFDTAAPSGTQVKVYVAPQNSGYNVTTRVDARGVVCGSDSRGGGYVTVGIYADGVRTGSVTYAHISPSVSVGQSISRWGGVVGTIRGGLPKDSRCWTGPHLHTEVWTNGPYASCYNGGYAHEQRINASNFIGFVGGTRATGIRQRCP